eukprot:355902-Chlamydomonas_euryale.AAC.2
MQLLRLAHSVCRSCCGQFSRELAATEISVAAAVSDSARNAEGRLDGWQQPSDHVAGGQTDWRMLTASSGVEPCCSWTVSRPATECSRTAHSPAAHAQHQGLCAPRGMSLTAP